MTAVTLRYRRLAAAAREGWQPLARPWQSAACAWTVLHDLYHHQPDDGGTLGEELATLGAEYYIDYEPLAVPGPEPAGELTGLLSAADGILGQVLLRQAPLPQPLALSAPPLPSDPESASPAAAVVLPHVAEHLCEQAAILAPARARLGLPEVLAWLTYGYCCAQGRFPDQVAVRERFRAGSSRLHAVTDAAPEGALLTASRQGYEAAFILESPVDELAG